MNASFDKAWEESVSAMSNVLFPVLTTAARAGRAHDDAR